MVKSATRKKAPPPKAPPAARTPRPRQGTQPEPVAATRRPRHGPPDARALLRSEPSLGKYVYCIIESRKPLRFGRLGIGETPSEVHTINFGDIAAVVSDTPILVYDPT